MPDPQRAPAGGRYPWVAMGVVLTGTFMVILDTTVVNVALPQIGVDLAATGGIEWVVTGYLLAVAVVQLATGWLSDRFGKKRTYTVSLALFALGSLAATVAPTLPVLVAFRVLQGLGGGAMMPVGLAMIYELFPPHRRGTALGIWGIAAMAAPALGPVIGGYLTTAASWRWVFAVNVPIGIVGVVLAVRLLRDVGFRETRPLDWRSLAVAATALVLVLAAFDRVSELGWTAFGFVGPVVAAVGLLAWFVRRELAADHPLIEVRMFTVGTFSLTIAIVWLITSAQFARLVFIPLDLQLLHGLSALEAGLVLAPAAVGTAVTMPLGGRLADRVGPRTPVVGGLVLIAVALWRLAHLTPATPIGAITVDLVIQGLGTGLAMMPNTLAAMNALPDRYVSRASAVRSLNRQVAGSVGVAVLAGLVAAQVGTVAGSPGTTPARLQAAYNDAFLVAFVGVVAAALLALWLPGRDQTRALQERRTREYVDPTAA